MLFLDTPPRAALRRGLALLAAVSGLLLAAPAAGAATRQVSPGGSDSGNCLASACRSLAYAYGQSASGDVVRVGAGAYPSQTVPGGHEGRDLQGRRGRQAPPARQRRLERRVTTVSRSTAPSRRPWPSTTAATTSTFRNGRIGNVTDEKGALVSGTGFTFDNVVFHDVRVTDPSVHNECMYAIVVPGLTVRNSLFHNCATMDLFFTYGSWWTPLPPAYGDVTLENNVFGHTYKDDGTWHYYSALRGQHRERRRHARRLGRPQQHLRDRRRHRACRHRRLALGRQPRRLGVRVRHALQPQRRGEVRRHATRPWVPPPRRRRSRPRSAGSRRAASTSACARAPPRSTPPTRATTRPSTATATCAARRPDAGAHEFGAGPPRPGGNGGGGGNQGAKPGKRRLVRSAKLRPRLICKHRRRSCARSARLSLSVTARSRLLVRVARLRRGHEPRRVRTLKLGLRKRPALRIRARGLPRGRYRVLVVATSAAGVKSSARVFTPARPLSARTSGQVPA